MSDKVYYIDDQDNELVFNSISEMKEWVKLHEPENYDFLLESIYNRLFDEPISQASEIELQNISYIIYKKK